MRVSGCLSSNILKELLGDTLGLPSLLTVAAKQRIVSAMIARISAFNIANALFFLNVSRLNHNSEVSRR